MTVGKYLNKRTTKEKTVEGSKKLNVLLQQCVLVHVLIQFVIGSQRITLTMIKQTQIDQFFKITTLKRKEGNDGADTKSLKKAHVSPSKKTIDVKTTTIVIDDGQPVDNDKNKNKDLIVETCLNNINSRKNGLIQENTLNLELIFEEPTYQYVYDVENINVDVYTPTKGTVLQKATSLSPTNVPPNGCRLLILTVIQVMANPVNCGYFDNNEVEFIESIITLPVQAQQLLTKFLRRKRTLHRKSTINYPDIGPNLEPLFRLLDRKGICLFGIPVDEDLPLELLRVHELRIVCKKFKIQSTGTKPEIIKRLQNLSNAKPLFPSGKSVRANLNSLIFEQLGYCVRLTNTTWQIFDRLLTLLIPNGDPKMNVSEMLYNLFDVYLGKTIYPNMCANPFPIFSSRLHLISYVEARAALHQTYDAIKRKDWETVRTNGKLAMKKASPLLKFELRSESKIPLHVRDFMPGYVWLKILEKSIDSFKKSKDTIDLAVEALDLLINQECHMETRKGKWCAELALIEMHHNKNLRASAEVTVLGLRLENLTDIDRLMLLDRATKILKSKTKVIEFEETLHGFVYKNFPPFEGPTITINACLMRGTAPGSKSKWLLKDDSDGQTYGSVEDLALYYYDRHGFKRGLHVEGIFPVTLFFILFWEEIYETSVPGANVTLYQIAPHDLHSTNFYKNRKKEIDLKCSIIESMSLDELSTVIEEKFDNYKRYESPMGKYIFKDGSQLKEIVNCIGVKGVLAICKKLIENYKVWKSGFPDLLVWNVTNKQYKIVEVKGPKDELSFKQTLWLEYLRNESLCTEVCLVRNM